MKRKVVQYTGFIKPNLITAFLIIITSFPSIAYAQVDSALGFFPLNTGDIHQYNYHYSPYPCMGSTPVTYSSYVIERVLGDTVLPPGFTYKIIQSDVMPYLDEPLFFLRVDTASANVYIFMDYPSPHEAVVESLRTSVDSEGIGGSFMVMDGYYETRLISIDTPVFLDAKTLVKWFDENRPFGANYRLAYGFGRIQHIKCEENNCWPLLDNFYYDLVYAKINGQEYGTYVHVDEEQNQSPLNFELAQNYPNPFNPQTTIKFYIPHLGFVSLKVFNLIGQEIATLIFKELQAGEHSVNWDAKNIASGVYFYRLTVGDIVQTKKLVLLK